MQDFIQKALTAKRESKYIEFKQGFDPNSAGDWCEIVKDIAAVANSGGGIIVFGLDNVGTPTGADLKALGSIDPADIGNKISKYTGSVALEFEVREFQKKGKDLHAFVIQPVSIPIIFQKPGTYDIGGGKQRTAFSTGTVYFRHGAKSEPGTSDDIRLFIERQLETIRKSWIKGVRRVVQAPPGSQIVALQNESSGSSRAIASSVRVVKDPNALPVMLTRDPNKASGVFVHEEVSETMFEDINNVIEANRLLAKGQQRFCLGLSVYYRVYAERQNIQEIEGNAALLFRSAVCELYAPSLYWAIRTDETFIAQVLTEIYLKPKSPGILSFVRIAVLLGSGFCDWLQERLSRKWKGHPQPPSFYFAFKETLSRLKSTDSRVLAARVGAKAPLELPGENAVTVSELLKNHKLAAELLSKACGHASQEKGSNLRSLARSLDYLSYGAQLSERSEKIVKAIYKEIGDRAPGEPGTSE